MSIMTFLIGAVVGYLVGVSGLLRGLLGGR